MFSFIGLNSFNLILVFQDTQEKEAVIPERAEEVKLKAKYPNLGQKPGGSDFLMKRLQKGVLTYSNALGLEANRCHH